MTAIAVKASIYASTRALVLHKLQSLGLVSCLWFPEGFPYLAMASGHLCPERTEVTINQFVKIDCNGDRPGYACSTFSSRRQEVQLYR